MFADYHVHTSFSDDSDYPMEDVIKKAIELGLEELCFTEHVDYGVKNDWFDEIGYKKIIGKRVYNCNYNEYIKEFEKCKKKYNDKINLKFGIEFGMQEHTISKFQRDFEKYDFDFIILSCHQVEDKEFFIYKFQEGKTQEEYNLRYYQEILKVIRKYKNYSVLGHLDLIKRYDKIGEYPFEKSKEIITEILKEVIKDGKGIEVNTSNFRYKLPDLTPSRDILKLYKELGGTIITIGSDSHKEEHLAHKIPEIKKELKKMGYNEFYTFDKMKAVRNEL
ncbi:MAG: histidinol-phosphatase HisJ family protein [Fusobacteriaceae bacterium]|nr:histidinol-phosphatase HisJ family protein [Fusobacteriaceae bacterium]